MSDPIQGYITRLSAFSDLSPKERNTLATVLRVEKHLPGDVICKEGEIGRSCYFVVEGEVDVLKELDGGGSRVLSTLRSDSVFGHIALIDAGPRSATCRARERTTLLRLDRQDFDTLFSSGSRFALRFQYAVAQVASRQLREANRRLSMLIQQHRRPTQTQRQRMLSEVQDLLAASDSQASDAIRWIG